MFRRHPQTISFYRRRLPHWEVVNGVYFVTIHLAGAIPEEAAKKIHQMSDDARNLEGDALSKARRRLFIEMESWLDRADAVRHLAIPEVAQMTMEAIIHRQQTGVWDMREYVIMPSHVHLLFSLPHESLKKTLENFKTWTGGQAARIMALEDHRFWQKEWFDHWSRSAGRDDRFAAYIRENPVKAGLIMRAIDWPYGSAKDPASKK